MKAYSAYLFDLDGVLYRGTTPIHGAAAVITALCERGGHVCYLTNNSAVRPSDIAHKLCAMGIPCHADAVMTSAQAAALYLRGHGCCGKTAYVVGHEGLRSEIQAAGLHLAPDDGDHQADYVVVGIDREFTYQKLYRAQQALLGGAEFIATNRDSSYPVEGGVTPGGGAIVAAIATASGVEPFTIGKPERCMFDLVLARLGVPPEQVLMVGDRLDTDILGGNRAGVDTALVLTGVCGADEAAAAHGACKPTFVLSSLHELL